MPTKKPRITVTVEPEDKDRIAQISRDFGYTEAGLCAYIVRLFLSQHKGGPLPPLSEEYNQQLTMKLK